jgi:hypothetical protein
MFASPSNSRAQSQSVVCWWTISAFWCSIMAEQQPGSVVKKNSKGKPVSSVQKIMILIYSKFREQNEALSKTEMVKRVSEAAGICLTLVWQTIKEMEETHAVKSPPRKRNRKILFMKVWQR